MSADAGVTDEHGSVRGARIEIAGLVQGVGFRPWVHRLARDLCVRGWVWNDGRGVTVEAHAPQAIIEHFVRRLVDEAPSGAVIERVQVEDIPPAAAPELEIVASRSSTHAQLSVGPDRATCPDCLAELFDPADRRFEYPFTNCTTCGPRFTIVTGVPYDRPETTMVDFVMCEACRREYENPGDRRFHAQPNACDACGPKLRMPGTSRPLATATEALLAGEIVALKGLGGFHLACDATNDDAVARLRARKGRDAKPFAVMVRDFEQAKSLAWLDSASEAALRSPAAPIVLVPARGGQLSCGVAPRCSWVGLMLPYTPMHHLLLRGVDRPLVMTSGNHSDQPIEIDDDEALERLGPLADRFLVHDRPIAARADDSVVRVIAGAPTVLRRSRGYVPRPIRLPRAVPEPILGCGGLLKNTVCIAVEDQAYLSPHHGDLDELRASEVFEAGVGRLESLLGVQPRIVASDLHPDFASTRYARRRGGEHWIGVQHHHAHVASALAEHRLDAEVFGLACDGVGLGVDGTSWGGELLLASQLGFTRVATMRPLRLPGGDVAVREVWRSALSLLWDAFEGELPADLPGWEGVGPAKRRGVEQMLLRDVRCPPTHALGRYFDAVAALGLGMSEVDYEGQAPMRWEQIASRGAPAYPYAIDGGARPWTIDLRLTIRALVAELLAGREPAWIASRFHATVARAWLDVLDRAADVYGSRPVVLTGGCFANALLTSLMLTGHNRDRPMLVHRTVPPGDGGIALGQVWVAAGTAEAT